MNDFRTGLSNQRAARIDNYKEYINQIANCELDYYKKKEIFDESRRKVVEFLNSQDCGLGLGLEIRSLICGKYGEMIAEKPEGMSEEVFNNELKASPEKYIKGYRFTLKDGKQIEVGYFGRKDYDVETDDIKEYVIVFADLLERYNPDIYVISKKDDKQEFRRLLRKQYEVVHRDKLFMLCFALHLNYNETDLFLTKYSGQRTYNYRRPEEAIAAYCFLNDKENSYSNYLSILNEYRSRAEKEPVTGKINNEFSITAQSEMLNSIKTKEMLYDFLMENRVNFGNYSMTAHNEYMKLYKQALEKTGAENPEQLAAIIGEDIRGHSTLPKAITSNPMVSDRIRSLIREPRPTAETGELLRKKYKLDDTDDDKAGEDETVEDTRRRSTEEKIAIKGARSMGDASKFLRKIPTPMEVERKDLLFMKFFGFFQDDDYDYDDYKNNGRVRAHNDFLDECNGMLMRCGFYELTPLNKYENLILMSFFADRPYEVFEMIIDYSYGDESIDN